MNTTQTTEANGVRHEVSKGAIQVGRIFAGEFQKPGTLTAEIRQEVMTKSFYPSKKVTSSLNANVFDTADFGFGEKEFESVEQRVAWIPVPPNASMEQVQDKISAAHANGATIYRVLSNEPILDENQKYGISQGNKTLDDYANTQAVRIPENEETKADGTAGKLALDKAGNVQYRRTFFWLTPQKDVDVRDANKTYVSPELQAEMQGASVLQGQTIN